MLTESSVGIVWLPPEWDATTQVASLPAALRHALALQAAGVKQVWFVGADASGLPEDARLQTPVEAVDVVPPTDAFAISVRMQDTYHRDLPRRLLASAVRDGHNMLAAGQHGARMTVTAPAAEASHPEDEPPDATEFDMDGCFLLEVTTPQQLKSATQLHLQSLIKPTSGIFERLYMRPLSLRLTRMLMHTRITPNAISWITLGLALVSALLVALPEHGAIIAGGLLHMFMRVVDCIDGELARLRYQGSVFGAWLDTIGDGIGIAAFIAGVTWQLVMVQGQSEWMWWGVVGVVAWMGVQVVQISAALATDARGTYQSIEWGHRKQGKRSPIERLTAGLELFLRIDAISTFYGLAVIAGFFAQLLTAHTVLAVCAFLYFSIQLKRIRSAP
ncbi:MAG: CDP-alcohol phosphatidyltransferase family protein [Polyangiales bacterium]